MTAQQIIAALAERHRRDVFVPECKMGSEYLQYYRSAPGARAGARRLDAVAIRPTWTKDVVVGYEVKVRRADFVADKKWRDYLPPLSHFWFVTPFDTVDPKDIADPAGLIEVAAPRALMPSPPQDFRRTRPMTSGAVPHTWRVRKRAHRMDVDVAALCDVLKYVAFWRLPREPRVAREGA